MPKDAKESALLIALGGAFGLLFFLLALVSIDKVQANVVVPIVSSVVIATLGAAGITGAGLFVQKQTEQREQAKAKLQSMEKELTRARGLNQ